ncbi:RNA polymerase sigma factor [Paenibacillus lactis]|uniref:RNA polymerase sigma factor n=1 Tax=Paenibacillus lactis TaxID=228574 RepID=UPI00203A64BB|nr:RNA polymerase sigma factor [Paenibacillus lactis]MCM3494887.1 RNA polymerase sigma factor [Paenibacillus lactis]
MDVNELYENLKEDVRRYARSVAKHAYEADDLVQDAFIKAMKEPQLAQWPLHKQKAWFFRVIKNRLIDITRREKRLLPWDDDLDVTLLSVPNLDMETTEWLGRLPQSQSDIVFKRYWLGMSSQEIGDQLGLPAATIRYKLQAAIKKLRTYWEEDMK